jgi:hypothetical protein
MIVVQLRAVPQLSETPRPFVEVGRSSAEPRFSDPAEPPAATAPGSSGVESATRLSAAVRPNHPRSGGTPFVSPEPVRVENEVAVDAEPAAVLPVELESASLLVAHSFRGPATPPTARSTLPSLPEGSRWQRVGSASVEVGDAAKQASVEVARTFMRAGSSLARRFQVSRP